jgi:signal transduction histidine kinase
VVVRLRSERDALVFSVADDGRGFDRDATRSGMGLTNMADRMAALGGSLAVRSSSGAGTTVEGRAPAST